MLLLALPPAVLVCWALSLYEHLSRFCVHAAVIQRGHARSLTIRVLQMCEGREKAEAETIGHGGPGRGATGLSRAAAKAKGQRSSQPGKQNQWPRARSELLTGWNNGHKHFKP
jgi:hypothetical protein